MRFVVLGAGAVGATVGGRLAETGHEVLLVARGEHLRVMRAQGLRLEMPDRVLTQLVPAVEVGRLQLRPDDLLLIATKLQHAGPLLTEVAALPVGGSTAGRTLPLVCVQNGVAGERMALRRFARVHGVCVMLPATHLQPGVVQAQGGPLSGALDVGRFPGGSDETCTALASALTRSGFACTPRQDVMAWKRAKLLRNVSNALSVLAGPHPSGPAADELRRRATDEARSAFAAAGLTMVDDAEWDGYRGHDVKALPVGGTTRSGGSSWQSVARGTGSVETDYLNGEIVLLGRLHGVKTPVNAALQRESTSVVTRGDGPGGVDLDAVLASVDAG